MYSKLGYYRVGDFKTHSKLEAIQLHQQTGIHPEWDFNQLAFSSVNWKVEPYEDILELRVDKRLLMRIDPLRKIIRPSGYVLDTLQAVFYSLFDSIGFEECLVKVVNLGGDADSTGAVTGAIAGAYYGYDKIPKRWLEKIHCFDELNEVAEELFKLAKETK